MRLTVRIYKRHDLDLLYLYKMKAENFDFKQDLKQTLKDFIHNTPKKRKKIPEGVCGCVFEMPSFIQFHLNLDPKKDRDIIFWVRTITRGRRNNLIKNIYRNTFPVIYFPYNTESENHPVVRQR